MSHEDWVNALLEGVRQLGEEGAIAVDYIRSKRTRITFKRVRPSIGAFWTVIGSIHLNSRYYTYDTPLDDLRLRTLIVHEARHLQQGIHTALSVYGELDAWQLEFGIYRRVMGTYPHAAVAELMGLPLAFDRAVLRKAAFLMQVYAGKGYRSDLLPLFPVGREIRSWVVRT